MRLWDLTGGAAKLELALKTLQTKAADIGEAWSDDAYARFVETYLEPIGPRMQNDVGRDPSFGRSIEHRGETMPRRERVGWARSLQATAAHVT